MASGGRDWSSVRAHQVGSVDVFTVFSALPLISTVMPSCVKLRGYFTKLPQRTTGGLKPVLRPRPIWTVYFASFMTTYWVIQQPVATVIVGALEEHTENKWEGGTILFVLWHGEGCAGKENKCTAHFYRKKGFFKKKDLKEKQILCLEWYLS